MNVDLFKVKEGVLYFNGIKVIIDVMRKRTNLDNTLVEYDEAVKYALKNDAFESIDAKIYTDDDLLSASLEFDEEKKLVYDLETKRVVKIKGMNVLDTYYRCMFLVETYQG